MAGWLTDVLATAVGPEGRGSTSGQRGHDDLETLFIWRRERVPERMGDGGELCCVVGWPICPKRVGMIWLVERNDFGLCPHSRILD